MDASEIGKVIDKLAEKATVTAEALKPLAEETVRQVQVRGLAQAIFGGIGIALAIALVYGAMIPCAKRADKLGAKEIECAIAVISGLIALIFFGFGIGGILMGIQAYIAPIPTILGL